MSETILGLMPVGSKVKLKVNNESIEFTVLHQGLPNGYHSSCLGTWLMTSDIYALGQWQANANHGDGGMMGSTPQNTYVIYPNYQTSDVDSYLNTTFYNLLDSEIRNNVLLATIKKTAASGFSQIDYPLNYIGAISATRNAEFKATENDELTRKVFLLSSDEVATDLQNGLLDYFRNGNSNLLKARYKGNEKNWWLRTGCYNKTVTHRGAYRPADSNDDWTYYTTSKTDYRTLALTRPQESVNASALLADREDIGIRPALILPQNMLVSDDGDVYPNYPPERPMNFVVPENIMGGTQISLSWNASTDANDNIDYYIVERSVDGGSNWSTVYQGSGLGATNTVAFGTTSVIYRVKAVDNYGAQSQWTTSGQITVINNTAPTAPAGIAVPSSIRGGSELTITWSESLDAENNLLGYHLERSIDGGLYEELYNGEALRYIDSITLGWQTVQYRIRAYDPYATSGYVVSPVRLVINNHQPVITCSYEENTDLGVKDTGFTITYTVIDEDENDEVTITEKLDGVVKREHSNVGQSCAFQITGEYFQKVLNGVHTLTIEATDGKATKTYELTFTKAVHTALISLGQPMEAETAITACAISVNGYVPSDEDSYIRVEVTNNAKDAEPVWEDCTSEAKRGINYIFDNATAINGYAFNFRVTAENSCVSGEGGYITSIQGAFM